MISPEEVQYIAGLSRIHLQEEEVRSLSKNLEDILHYIAKLENLDVKDVQPTSHVFQLTNVFRSDTAKPSLPQKDALKFAVSQHNGSFKVPKVIE